MDPFNNLPAELQVEIMVQTRSRRTNLQFIQASPVMLQQYIKSKHLISRKVLALDLDNEMIQDAIAIILFPSQLKSGRLEISPLRLCRSWAAQKLPDPFRKQNDRLTDKLHKLHERLILFIEDYITKATAVFPPREYVCLPDLSPISQQLMFKDQKVKGCTRFDAANLTWLERRRLLRAFLRYQLISLIYRQPSEITGPWRVKLHQYRGKSFNQIDREGIMCVQAYVESLYGAIFAQVSDSWLPENIMDPTPTLNPGLLYPDNLYVNPNDYASDFGWDCGFLPVTLRLAFFGLDLVTILIRYATAGSSRRYQLEQWLLCKRPANKSEVFFKWSEYRPAYGNSLMGLHYEEGNYTESDDDEMESGSYTDFTAKNDDLEQGSMEEEDLPEPALYRVLCSEISESSQIHKAIYRQRAWVFLDDARLYPSSDENRHLPTSKEFDELQLNGQRFNEAWFSDLKRARRQRRSRTWHDRQRAKSSGHKKIEEFLEVEPEKDLKVPLPRVTDHRLLWIPCPFWH